MSEEYRASKQAEWLEVFRRQVALGTSVETAWLVADRVVGSKHSPFGKFTPGSADVAFDVATSGGLGKGATVGLGKFLKKVIKVAAPIALGVATGGTGAIAAGGLKQLAGKAIAGKVIKQTLAKKAMSALTTRVLPGVGKIAKGAARLSGQAAKIGAIGAAIGGGAAVGTRVGRGSGESLDVTFQDESGMIVKTKGRRRPGRTRKTGKSRRSAPIRRRSGSSRRRAAPRRATSRRPSSRRAAPRRAGGRRGSTAQRRARSNFVRRFAKKGRRRSRR